MAVDNTISKLLGSFTRSSGEFRSAAAKNDNNISKVIKDVSAVFSSNKSGFSSISSSIDGLNSSFAQSTSRIDQTNSLLQQSISIQNQIVKELRDLGTIFKQGGGRAGGAGGDGTGGAAGGIKASIEGVLNLLGGKAGIIGTGVGAAAGIGLGVGANSLIKNYGGEGGTTSKGGQGGALQQNQVTFGSLTEDQKTKFLENQAKAENTRAELNNPGAIQFGAHAKKYGAEAGTNNGTITLSQFPSMEAGKKAQRDLWESPAYRDLPLDQAISKWTTGDSNAPLSQTGQNYKSTLTKGVGLEANAPSASAGPGGMMMNAPSPGSPLSGDTTSLAESMVGKSETMDNKEIAAFLKAGGVSMNPAAEAWCAAFVNSALAQTGQKGSNSQVATSFLNWGAAVPAAQVQRGDVIVEPKGKQAGQTGGHVGIATGQVQGSQVEMISGNSGHKVAKTWVDTSKGDVQIRRGSGAAATGAAAGTGVGMGANAGMISPMEARMAGMGMGPMGGMGMGGMPGMDPYMALGGALGGMKGAAIGGIAGLAMGAVGSLLPTGEDSTRRTMQMNAVRENAAEKESLSESQARATVETRNARSQEQVVNNQFSSVAPKPSDYNNDKNSKADWYSDLANAFPELKGAVKFAA